jgi:hypothetical protein
MKRKWFSVEKITSVLQQVTVERWFVELTTNQSTAAHIAARANW